MDFFNFVFLTFTGNTLIFVQYSFVFPYIDVVSKHTFALWRVFIPLY